MTWLSRAAGAAWWASCLPEAWAFRHALRNPADTQERLLLALLRRNAGTAFGEEHRFDSIRSVRDFQERVPAVTYDDLAPWIERSAAGEPGVLTRDRVGHFALSSGSTRAAKLVPYTASLHREFRRAIAPWMVDLFSRRPDLAAGPAYWSISPVAREATRSAGGIPIGFEEDSSYLGGGWRRLVDAMMAVPPEVRHLQDMDRFRFVTSLHLLRCRELRILSIWHPSFLELLLEAITNRWDELLREVGGARATELSRLEPGRWTRIWPRLGLVSCWGDAQAAGPMQALRARFPGVEVQPKGLIATEAFVTVPFAGRHPVAVRSHFFEFVDPEGRPRLLHELDEGPEYSVLVTTGGGLCRYRLQDRVRVDGLVEATPSLRFVGKEDAVSDLCGEKLNESFAGECQRGVLARHGATAPFSMLVPATGGPGYVWLLEAMPPPGAAEELDLALGENPHYRYARDLGQLSAVEVVPLPAGSYRRYVEHCVRGGQRAGDVKPRALDGNPEWTRLLGGEPVRIPG